MLVGVLATMVTFIALTYLALGLFTSGAIVVAWFSAWAIGMMAARVGGPWKKELLTALVLALVVGCLNLAFFKGLFWWGWWSP